MKRLSYLAVIAAAGMFLASCQPEVIEGGVAGASVSPEQVQSAFVIDGQFADAACTTPQSDGNFIKYHTSPAVTVQISQYKPDGSANILATGASGVFNITPKRGNPSQQQFVVTAINPDASQVSFTSNVTVYVPSELSPEYKLLLGDGVKSWMWDWTNAQGTCWGNAGNSGAGEAFTARNVDGHWWGVTTPEELLDQLAHSGGVATGAESSDAYMTFDEDMNITTFGAGDTKIYASTYEIKDYNPSRPSGWEVGKLVTATPSVLFPFSINEGGKNVSEFDLMYLDANYMTLVYTKGNGAGSWGEITFWKFKNKDGYSDALCGGSSRNWKWDITNAQGTCWGNAGNSGAGAAFTPGYVDGHWWGVATPEELLDQLAHSGGVVTGAESSDAYMTFNEDGSVFAVGADGSPIGRGSWEVADFDASRPSGWELGKLKVDGGGILFPYSINEGGVEVHEFDLMYIDADNMTLVYTKGNGAGSWGEITFWKFVSEQ
ncbi:MAG: hypothetical protein MJY70_03325 [Bacteroidales bacterium]|nr:hypothetical protein [Bacteroidales bacterium]